MNQLDSYWASRAYKAKLADLRTEAGIKDISPEAMRTLTATIAEQVRAKGMKAMSTRTHMHTQSVEAAKIRARALLAQGNTSPTSIAQILTKEGYTNGRGTRTFSESWVYHALPEFPRVIVRGKNRAQIHVAQSSSLVEYKLATIENVLRNRTIAHATRLDMVRLLVG
jgi:hypothetical protein